MHVKNRRANHIAKMGHARVHTAPITSENGGEHFANGELQCYAHLVKIYTCTTHAVNCSIVLCHGPFIVVGCVVKFYVE